MYDSRHQNFPDKLHTRWMGPYKVAQVFSNGSLQFEDVQGNRIEIEVNGLRVKKYHPVELTKKESRLEMDDLPGYGSE